MNDRNNDKFARLMLEHLADALDEDDEALRGVATGIRFQIARDCAAAPDGA